jgi:hypothetical protein
MPLYIFHHHLSLTQSEPSNILPLLLGPLGTNPVKVLYRRDHELVVCSHPAMDRVIEGHQAAVVSRSTDEDDEQRGEVPRITPLGIDPLLPGGSTHPRWVRKRCTPSYIGSITPTHSRARLIRAIKVVIAIHFMT